MAQSAAAFSPFQKEQAHEVVVQSQWQTICRRFCQDKIALLATILFSAIVLATLAAPWISSHWLGFDPLDTSLLDRNKPPTWAKEAWPQFQRFTQSCQKNGCAWRLWRTIAVESTQGMVSCFRAEPGVCHWLGTDATGRDVFVRGLHGGRVSLRIGLIVAMAALGLGVSLGLISGYYATSYVDDIINALIQLINSIPVLLFLIVLSRLLEPGAIGLALLLSIFRWTNIARALRGQIFSLREQEYIVASRAVGSSVWRILLRQILPNVASLVIVFAVFSVADAIIAEAGLSYLGVGIGPPTPSWGNMMQGSLSNFTNAPWLVLGPGLFIFLTTLSIYLMGDGLRDALDPMLAKK